MRRKDKEFTDKKEIEEILSTAKVGRLGTSVNDNPYITPVNFVHTNGRIFIHSANEGHKLDNIGINPNVCFEVEDVKHPVIKEPICASTVIYRSIIMFGKAKVIQDRQSKCCALNLLIEKYTNKPFTGSFTDAALDRVTVIEIAVENLTAKRSPAQVSVITDPGKK